MKEAGPLPGQRDGQGDAVAAQEAQPRSRVVKPGDKRSKKGKRRIDSGAPPPLAPDDYVKVVPVSKRSEVSFPIPSSSPVQAWHDNHQQRRY